MDTPEAADEPIADPPEAAEAEVVEAPESEPTPPAAGTRSVPGWAIGLYAVSYTHLRAHET